MQLSPFARLLLKDWRKLGLPEKRATVVTAVSGGADSVALLLALSELLTARKLDVRVVVAHLNHKLRGKASDADAAWVRTLAKKLGHRFSSHAVNIKERARKQRGNVEQIARRARYEFLRKVAETTKASVILTAHTMDDQAETILMNLLRGSGTDGLGGIEPARSFETDSKLLLARPLLSWARRVDTENYCRQQEVDYRVDEMNADETFARVRIRRQLIPLMTSFNPRFTEGIARTAEILREDVLALESAAAHLLDLSLVEPANGESNELGAELLRIAQPALRRRALRLWIARCRGDLRRLELVHIEAVENLLFGRKSGRTIELPGGAQIWRHGGSLHYRAGRG